MFTVVGPTPSLDFERLEIRIICHAIDNGTWGHRRFNDDLFDGMDKIYRLQTTWRVEVPKWWRWYDKFRTWAPYRLLPQSDACTFRSTKPQEPRPRHQHAQRKRRRFIQSLRSKA